MAKAHVWEFAYKTPMGFTVYECRFCGQRSGVILNEPCRYA